MGKPSEIIECEGCGGDVVWDEIVWDFADKVEGDGDTVSLTSVRRGWAGVCSKCALIQALSFGEINLEPDFSPPSEAGVRTLSELTMVSADTDVEVMVVVAVDEESVSNSGTVFAGEVIAVEDSVLSLEGERVWVDLDESIVRRDSEDGEVIGTSVWPGDEG